jgi:hypothetical protein
MSFQPSPARAVVIPKERECPWMPVNFFMSARVVAKFCVRSPATAAFTARMVTPSVRLFSRMAKVAAE